MRAVDVPSPGSVHLIDIPAPTPGPGEVAIAVEASGICGTDLRIIAGDYGHARLPVVIGHEFAGRIAALGDGVTGFEVGQFVTADPNLHCGTCEWCRKDAFNLCEHSGATGVNRPGALADVVTIAASVVIPLPESLPATTAALIEPLSCVLHAMDRLGPVAGGRMLIYGGGAIGLMAAVVATDMGASVQVVEPHEPRRALARELGADAAAADVAALPDGGPFDVVLDASGALAAIADGLGRLRPRGTLLQMGVAPSDATLPYSPYQLYEKEWRIIGSNSVEACFPAACEAMPRLADRLGRLVTHTFPLARFDEALAVMTDPAALKVQLLP